MFGMSMILKAALPMITDETVQGALGGLKNWLQQKNAELPEGQYHVMVVEPDATTQDIHIRVWTRDATGNAVALIIDQPLSQVTADNIKTLLNALSTDKK